MTDSLENQVQVALSEEAKPGKGPLEAKEACLTGEAGYKPVEEEMEDMDICSRNSAEFRPEDPAALPVMPPA